MFASKEMKKIGTMRTKAASEIITSHIGVGFECLDRKMWDDVDDVYQAAAVLGAKHARVQTGWYRTETASGIYDFAWLDAVVDKLIAIGVHPWLNLGYGNVLYTDAKEQDACGWVPIFTEKARAGWTCYIAALVAHFKGRVTHYEIWNEPDNQSFWRPGKPSSEGYVDLVALTTPIIRRLHPDAKIIVGDCGLNLWDVALINQYLVLGLGKWADIFSYHRYRVMPEIETPELIHFVRNLFKRNGAEHLELWQGESGFPSVTSSTQALSGVPVDETVQAKMLARSILLDLVNDLDYTSYFTMSDFKFYYNNGYCENPNFFGLLTCDTPPRRKPSFDVFQRLCTLFSDDINLDRSALVTLETCDVLAEKDRFSFHERAVSTITAAFRRNGAQVFVWWQKSSGISSHEPYPVNLLCWSPELRIEEPLLIDPMDGAVYAVDFIREEPDFRIKVLNVPLKDYPILLVDRNAIAN